MFKNAVIVMLVLAGLALASCSGGAGAPLDELNNTDNVSETQSLPQAEGDESQADGQLSSIEWTAAEVDAPLMGRDASDWQIFDPIFPDFNELFEAMHYTVAHGENEVPVDNFMTYGGGASYDSSIVGFDWVDFHPEPIYGYALTLASTEQDPAFATFGFKEFPAGERLSGIEVDGMVGVVYIGVAGYGSKDAWRWFGPYDLSDGPAVLDLPYLDSTNDDNHGYVTLLTQGGNTAVIDSFKVYVDQQSLLPEIDVEIPVIDELPEWGI